jgi:hypothetical protein
MSISTLEYLKTITPSQSALDVLGATFGVSAEENAALIQHGFWHVCFFANQFAWLEADSNWIGVRIVPGVNMAECPVVSVNRFGATTISPTLKNLIPNWILYTQIDAENWLFIQQEWASAKADLLEIHLKLGGEQALFERFEAYLNDDSNFSRPNYLQPKSRAIEYLQVDRSVETTRFRSCIQNLINNENDLPDFSNDFGAWTDFARSVISARAYTLRANKQRSLTDTVQSLWLGFDKSAPFDSDIGQPLQFHIARDPADRLRSLALAVTEPWPDEAGIPDRIQNDPLFPAAQALGRAEHAFSYRGVEHMEAAAKLDIEYGDGRRSYEALISASFWSAMSLGFPYPQAYQAAFHLSQKYRWDEMSEMLEVNEFELQDA